MKTFAYFAVGALCVLAATVIHDTTPTEVFVELEHTRFAGKVILAIIATYCFIFGWFEGTN